MELAKQKRWRELRIMDNESQCENLESGSHFLRTFGVFIFFFNFTRLTGGWLFFLPPQAAPAAIFFFFFFCFFSFLLFFSVVPFILFVTLLLLLLLFVVLFLHIFFISPDSRGIFFSWHFPFSESGVKRLPRRHTPFLVSSSVTQFYLVLPSFTKKHLLDVHLVQPAFRSSFLWSSLFIQQFFIWFSFLQSIHQNKIKRIIWNYCDTPGFPSILSTVFKIKMNLKLPNFKETLFVLRNFDLLNRIFPSCSSQ